MRAAKTSRVARPFKFLPIRLKRSTHDEAGNTQVKRARTFMAAAFGALAIACASTSIAMVHSTSVLAAGMFAEHGARAATRATRATRNQAQAQARTQPWWAGFEDASMGRLMAAARGADEPGVAAAYIALKVKTLELVYLENTRAAVTRQAALVGSGTPRHDDFEKQLAQRQLAADDNIGKLKAQRTSYLAYLAARCGMPQAALEALLADALQDRSLPRFAAEVPSELPMAVLANRNDVQLAAALYGADTDALPGGVIDTSGEAPDIDAPGIEASGQPLYAHAVMQARDQVAGALQHLQMQSDIANTAYARVVDARADFEASKQRRDRGDISEVQLMEDFQGLLLDLHVLAAANGELAMAWVLFMGNVGGASGMGNDTAIDAMATPQATQATQARELPFLHKVSRKLRNP
jgi:hypothetical protein